MRLGLRGRSLSRSLSVVHKFTPPPTEMHKFAANNGGNKMRSFPATGGVGGVGEFALAVCGETTGEATVFEL